MIYIFYYDCTRNNFFYKIKLMIKKRLKIKSLINKMTTFILKWLLIVIELIREE